MRRNRATDRVHRVNKVPFREPLPPANNDNRTTRATRSPTRRGAHRRTSCHRPSYSIVLGTLTDGGLVDVSESLASTDDCPSPSPNRRDDLEYDFIPFTNNVNNEPILRLRSDKAPFLCFVDTGSGVDLIPRHILDHHFPEWPKRRLNSDQKLVAANNKPVHHQGRVTITLPLPLQRGGIQICPFIVDQANDENTMILGYDTMKKYHIVPIPGSGCLAPKSQKPLRPTPELWEAIQRHPICRVRNLRAEPESTRFWVAKPCEHAFVPAFKRVAIFIKPRTKDLASVNYKNGTKVLVRECPCVTENEGEECESCIRSENQVQMCTLVNGTIKYTVDNTHSGCSRTITPKNPFFVTFDTIFDIKSLAERALDGLEDEEFEFEVPTNQYSEQECNDLFDKTREEVTRSLRSIVCEPASWSLEGYRPETLRLIDSEGRVSQPSPPHGNPIPMTEFTNLNPCPNCEKEGDGFCNIEREDCDLRSHIRRRELPGTFESTLIQHDRPFQPASASSKDHMVVGCHRIINKHATAWDRWYPKSGQGRPPGPRPHLRLHKLCDAVITEVSRAKMILIAEEASLLGLSDLHFTNFHGYGISLNLLQRCIPSAINLHIYPSEDTAVAGPGYDPRRRPGHVHPSVRSRSCPKPREPPAAKEKEPDTGGNRIPPGLPKPIRAEEVPEIKDDAPNILTDDPALRRKCLEMLDAHKKVFSSTPSDCGQFVDPDTKAPYYFKVRLKGKEPPKEKTRFVSFAKEQAATELLSGLLAGNIIKRRFSPYCSQSVYVAKKRKLLTLEDHVKRGGSASSFVPGTIDPQAPLKLRHCIDLSKVNEGIIEDNLASLSPKQMILRLAGSKSTALLDLQNAYLGLTLHPDSELVTGFESGVPSLPGRFCSARASMGLCSSAKFLEIGMAKTLAQASGQYLRFCDDLIVIGDTDQQVLERLSSILDLLESHGWLVKKDKMVIFSKRLTLFGLSVDLSEQTVSAPRTSLDAVLLRPRPASKEECKSFAGVVAWWSETLGRHGDATSKLHKMTRKDTAFEWTQENLEAYEHLQELFSMPALHTTLPNYDLPFEIVCDSSEFATGALLLQITAKGDIKIISYVSHIHDERTARLSSFERESYAMIYSLATFYDLVAGHPTCIHSDSRASVLISMLSKSNSKICRWSAMLHGLPWVRVSWCSSKSQIMKLADWLSRRPAGSKEWKNRQPTSEDLETISLAASKLKRDINMSIRGHEIITEYICSLSIEELESLENESVYIDTDDKVHVGNLTEPQEHARLGDKQDAGTMESPGTASHHHPAFQAKPSTGERQASKSDDMLTKVPGETESDPERDAEPGTEPARLPNEEDPAGLYRISSVSGTRGSLRPFYGTIPGTPEHHAPAQRGRSESWGPKPASLFPREEMGGNQRARSVYTIKAKKMLETSRDHNVLPENVLTLEEADDLGMISPASQAITTPRAPTWVSDYPPEPRPGDTQGTFLRMCFEKSPWTRMSTLIEAQERDPLLNRLRDRSRKAPAKYGGATFVLKENVLLRITNTGGLEHIQVCLPRDSGYNLCLKAHIGSTKGNWRGTLGAALHNGTRKLYSLVSERFWFENMQKLCNQIPESCYICTESKPNIAKNRKDAHRSVVTPSIPGECWSIDLLTLPSMGKCGATVLTCQDYYSRYGVVIPVERAATSEYLFHLLSWYLLGPMGRCRVLVCDNAKHLVSSAMRQALNQLSVELRTVPIYSGRSNLVEGFNRLILLHLRLYHNHFNIPYGCWRETLPHLVSAINFTPFSGEMGQKYHLSPAKIYFGEARATLDPTDRMDFPYLSHMYRAPVDWVKKVADAAWTTHQIVTAHKQKLMDQRKEKGDEGNKRFSSIKDFQPGDVVLVDNLLRPGASSKLRPRASFRYVVMKQTESSVFCRPWSQQSLERWSAAQKYTSQTKDAIALLPLVKLPKERVRLDKSLKLWNQNSRIPQSHLLRGLSQDDPEPIHIEVEELEYGNDWLDMDSILKPAQEGEEDPLSIPGNLDNQEIPAPAPVLPEGRGKPRIRDETSKGILKPPTAPQRRSPRLNKSCRFVEKARGDDGSTEPLKDLPGKCYRLFLKRKGEPDLLTDYDDEHLGDFVATPSTSGSPKLTHISPKALGNRACPCKRCMLQLPKCRTTPCVECQNI